MGDIFNTWLEKLPKERQFNPSELPSGAGNSFSEWMSKSGRKIEPSYDYVGAFVAGIPPTEGHLPSFGIGGKLLKNPNHPTVWKTGFVEMAHAITGKWIDPDELNLDRNTADKFLQHLIKNK